MAPRRAWQSESFGAHHRRQAYPDDFALDQPKPAVKVRLTRKKNGFEDYARPGVGAFYPGPLKSRAGRRTIRLGAELVGLLRHTLSGLGRSDLVSTGVCDGMVDQPHFFKCR